MVLQATGPLSISQIVAQYGASFNHVNSMLGIAAGVPVSVGPISFSQMLGTGASIPQISGVGTQTVPTSSGQGSGTITSINNWVTDTYGAPLTYSYSSKTSHIPSVSVTGTTVTYSGIPQNTFSSGTDNISVVVTNRFGKTATMVIPFTIMGSLPVLTASATGVGTVTLTNNAHCQHILRIIRRVV